MVGVRKPIELVLERLDPDGAEPITPDSVKQRSGRLSQEPQRARKMSRKR